MHHRSRAGWPGNRALFARSAALPSALSLVLLVLPFAFASACSESHGSEPDAAITVDLDAATLEADAGPPPDSVPIEDPIGEACSSDGACGTDGVCLSDPDFLPGGYCSRACARDEDCGSSGACLMLGRGQRLCFRTCAPGAVPRPCRAGYGCGGFGLGAPPVCLGGCSDDGDCPSGLTCDPGRDVAVAGTCFDPGAAIGDACASGQECPSGGFCLDEGSYGWPAGACIGIRGCDLEGNTGCDGDAQCIPTGMSAICVDGCASAGDCRPGFECAGSMAFPMRRICRPACAGDEQCSSGNVCNRALGTCDQPFDPDDLGGECSRSMGGCDGGTCLSEAELGFPGGSCAYSGCAIGDDRTCPIGGACAPTAGRENICLARCVTDSDCRSGYACRNVEPADTTSSLACLPACTSDSDCVGMMPRCNAGTGLCTVPFVAARQGEPCADGRDCPGGRCLSDAEGWPAGYCAAIGCALMSGAAGIECPSGASCIDDRIGRPEIGHCLDACSLGAPAACRTGYRCVEGMAGAGEGVCQPGPA